jgi:hypothetical protein
MSKEREILQKILATNWLDYQLSCEVKELLAKPEQEPVAWFYERQIEGFTELTMSVGFEENFDGVTIPLYLAPPTHEPLSDEKIYDIFSKNQWKKFIELARAIEKAHGIGVDDE